MDQTLNDPHSYRHAKQSRPNGRGLKHHGRRSNPAAVIFVLFMSVGIFVTTTLGIWTAFRYEKSQRLVVGVLLAGIIIPILTLVAGR